MDKIILDTSVIVKWFSLEKDREQALKICDSVVNGKTVLLEPELIFYELINALWFGKKFSSRKVAKLLEAFCNLEPKIISLTPKLTAAIVRLIKKFPITSYDSSFIALANEYKVPLITADTKHHKKSYSKFIVPLANY